jgi:hypothetical protein
VALGFVPRSVTHPVPSPSPHGPRRSDLYVDPSFLLAVAPPAEPESAAENSAAPSHAKQGKAHGEQAKASAVPHVTGAPVLQVGSAPLATTRPAAATGAGAVGMPAGVSLARASGADAAAVAQPAAGPTATTWSEVADVGATERLAALAERVLHSAARWLRVAGPLGFAAIVAAMLASALLLGRRALERRVTSNPPVSDRLGRLLQQLRAGDTLRGLTSCSGHAAFTVPGPSSPEEVTK